MAKMMPKQMPLFEVKDFILCREEEISQYIARFDLPKHLAEVVYEDKDYVSALENPTGEDVNPYITKIFGVVEEMLCYKKDGTFIGTKSVSCSVFRHRPNPNYRKRRYKTKWRVSKDILWVIVGATEKRFNTIQQNESGLSITPPQRYLVPVLHKRRTRIYKNS